MRELFVWYRVGAANTGAARHEVQAMQASLCADGPGLEARLLARDDAGGGPQTWMETYALRAAANGVDAELQATIDARAAPLLALIDGDRHGEVFAATSA